MSEKDVEVKKLKAQLDDEGYRLLITNTRFGDLADPSNPYFNFFLLINAIDWFPYKTMTDLLDGNISIDFVAYCLCRSIKVGKSDDMVKKIFEELLKREQQSVGMKKELHDYVLLSIKLMSDYIFRRGGK